MRGSPRSASATVVCDRPASRATSRIVGRKTGPVASAQSSVECVLPEWVGDRWERRFFALLSPRLFSCPGPAWATVAEPWFPALGSGLRLVTCFIGRKMSYAMAHFNNDGNRSCAVSERVSRTMLLHPAPPTACRQPMAAAWHRPFRPLTDKRYPRQTAAGRASARACAPGIGR